MAKMNQLGEILREDLYDHLFTFFSNLTLEKWHTMQERCAAAPDRLFAGEADYVELSARLEQMAENAGQRV